MKFSSLISLIRPTQWAKNLFVFLPLFFSGNLTDIHNLLQSLLTFFAFCLTASSVYCFNDIHDVEADRQHPKKRKRPIASGQITIPQAYIIMILLLATALGITCFAYRTIRIDLVLFIYLIMNLAYCVWLKNMSIIDVFIISFGFVLRIIIGGIATNTEITHWIVIMTFLLALFMAIAKRRDDVLLHASTKKEMRKNIRRYNIEFINQSLCIIAGVTMVAYIMYTVSPEVCERFNSNYIYCTSIFVLFGLLRYLQLTIVDNQSGSPTHILLHDRPLQLCIVCWLITFFIIVYS